jgi:3-hydroxyisobutyrate dehydrogenase-like beta-hydroxyacid dehydrogenase
MQYAVAEARHFSIDLTTASAANEVMQQAIAVGLGDKDISAIIELLRK